MKRRDFLSFVAGAAAWPVAASAQQVDYPNRTVRIVIGFGAGGGTDTVARIVAQKLQEALGGTFLVENKPGASGRLAPDTVAKSAPDGYTLLGAAPGAMTVGTPRSARLSPKPGRAPYQFRKIQVCPKDLLVVLRQPGRAVTESSERVSG